MRILVTGGSGLVGKYIVDELAKTQSVESLDLVTPHRPGLPFHCVDLLDFDAVVSVVKDYDIVVHLAGIPHPLTEPADTVFRVNTLGTFNVLEACAVNGIQRFILMSSESTLGFAFSTTRIWPEFIPITESHLTRPRDPYGLSKVVCELLCQGYTHKTGMQTLCLRPPWIWVPEPKEVEFYKQLIKEYPKWYKNLWAYCHVLDVAQAVRLCVESNELPRHDVYFICADDNWTGIESRKLLAEFYPETTSVASGFTGTNSFISNLKAKQAFGFAPAYTWRNLISEVVQ